MSRILLVNKFYYPRGGDCVAVLNQEKLLKQNGHEVAIFSSRHKDNLPSVWEAYFPSEISFASPGIKGKLSAVSRLFYSSEVKDKFTRLLDDFKPDIVHVHNIHSYLSPYVVQLASRRGIKVVWTLHDYKLLCPAYTCLREGEPCELCFHDKKPVIKYRCMKQDIKASVLSYLEAKVWNRKVLEKYTHVFISPSHFNKSKMVAGGFSEEKINVLHNFFIPEIENKTIEKSDYYCYVGRLSYEKGIDSLLEAAKNLPYTLKVVGGGDRLAAYRTKYPNDNIEFMGYLPHEEVLDLTRKARFTVVPSICYENNPLSVIESLCVGTPVLGARVGGIPELIRRGENGFLFSPHAVEELKEEIIKAFDVFTVNFDYQQIKEESLEKFKEANHYAELMRIYGL